MHGLARGPRRVAVLTLVSTLVLGVAFASPVSAGYRHKLLRMVNASRARHDLRLLKVDRSLARDAARHTRRMLRRNTLYDPRNLSKILEDEPWERMGGSVVGCGSSLWGIHKAFMRHRAHRVIVLNKKLRRIGIGVRRVDADNACGDGSFWVTELFYG